MLPSLFTFDSLGKLLQAILVEEKHHFSTPQKRLAEELHISASLLSLICDGKRNLSYSGLLRLSRKLKCQETELNYLEVLWKLSNETDFETVEFLENRKKHLKEANTVARLRVAAVPQFSHWHILPLFVYITDFVNPGTSEEIFAKCRHLAEKFEISEPQLRSEIDLLFEWGVLSFEQSDKVHLRFDKLTGEFSQIRFMQSLIKHALDKVPTHFSRGDSHFSAEAISLSKEEALSFYQKYKELVSYFVSLTSKSSSGQSVVMVSLQMLPLELNS